MEWAHGSGCDLAEAGPHLYSSIRSATLASRTEHEETCGPGPSRSRLPPNFDTSGQFFLWMHVGFLNRWLSLLKINVMPVGRAASKNFQSPSGSSTLIPITDCADHQPKADIAQVQCVGPQEIWGPGERSCLSRRGCRPDVGSARHCAWAMRCTVFNADTIRGGDHANAWAMLPS
jgi:hypothetical protein